MRTWACIAVAALTLALAAPAIAKTYKWRVSGSVMGTYSSPHSWVSCGVVGVTSIQEHVDVRAKLRPRGNSSYAPGNHFFGTSLKFAAAGGWHLSGTHTPRQEDPFTGELVCGAPLPVDCGGDVRLERGTTLGFTAVKRGRSFVAGYQFGHFYGASPSESPLGVCTAGGGDPEVDEQVFGLFGDAFGSENTRSRIEFPVARLTRGESFSVTGTPALPDPDACAAEYLTACTQSGRFVWELTFEPKGGLEADAGGPYTVVRGRRLRLDGSRSTPRGRIDSYRWTFQRAAPPDPPAPLPPVVAKLIPATTAQDAGCRPDHGGKQGKTTEVLPLCTIKATLTVRDGGETDSDTTTITVEPRDWQTPDVDLRQERYGRWGQPQHGTPDGSTFGLNIPGCGGGARIRDSYFCPLPDGDTWLGEAYTLDIVDDPKGPHNGRWWVKPRPKFEIRRRELVNAYMYAGAGVPAGSSAPKEFYAANKEAGFPIDDFIRYVERHEGRGQGLPRSGHTLAIVEAIRSAPESNDPQRVIESVVEPTERAARREADKRLRGAGERVCLNTRDPLTGPWTRGSPVAWDPTFHDFRPLEGVDFEGDPGDCA